MAASTSSMVYRHGQRDADSIVSPSAASSIAGPSSLYSAASTATSPSTTSLSATDHLRETFIKRIRSLTYLKRSLQSQQMWFSTISLSPAELSHAFDNDRMAKRTLRYSLLGLSLSSILELSNPSDMARAIVSLINELDGYTDEHVAALTTGTGSANFGTQRPRMRNLFKSGKQTLKRSTAAQAISEFGAMDSNMIGPSSALTAQGGGHGEPNSYLMAPNIPFGLDFFQIFFTLCDMLTEVYYKMLSFLPREATHYVVDAGTLGRAGSPPTSASRHASGEHDRAGSISQALSSVGMDESSDKAGMTPTVISGMTQELLLKADAKIRKTMNAQVKDIDTLAQRLIKDELSTLDPLMKDLGLDNSTPNSAFFSSNGRGGVAPSVQSATSSNISNGLPSSSTSSIPFGFSSQSSNTTSHSTQPSIASTAATSSKFSSLVSGSGLPSHFRKTKTDVQSSQDSAHHGHHQFNLASTETTSGRSGVDENGVLSQGGEGMGGIGSLIRSRSGRLRRVMSGEGRPSSLHGHGQAMAIGTGTGSGIGSGTTRSESVVPNYLIDAGSDASPVRKDS
ncbi:uncharacterized protein MEPE_03043 [Melanopsichium pennsylvanicum]|uniref:Uncharacterized protein n=2 Tax=Melanopsichium pennsylvanicum TaxID=63383 RepID=A0AAJ4XL33_9BASI|nr:conserved hypothetical protein [Melanopsichium pennsylvanicum 4]SNX84334.1 uncharacterized protein MEPE_03043 [Melanopsichium pennsylvanicum]